MPDLSLVVLAAGLGRRFGALKQVAAVGPDGAALVDHTVRDAARLGIDRVVAVVRAEIAAEVAAHLRLRSPLPVEVAVQPAPGPGRVAPWGTAEAVAVGLGAAGGPAVVANADDYYGADALGALVAWLRSPAAGPGRAALVTWPLAATTSPQGPVSRATCAVDAAGRVGHLVEHHGVARAPDGTVTSADGPLDPTAPVSMNLWGLPATVGPALAAAATAFRAAHAGDPRAELPLPTALDTEVAAGRLALTALPAGTSWVGVTHPDDLEPAGRALAVLVPPLPAAGR